MASGPAGFCLRGEPGLEAQCALWYNVSSLRGRRPLQETLSLFRRLQRGFTAERSPLVSSLQPGLQNVLGIMGISVQDPGTWVFSGTFSDPGDGYPRRGQSSGTLTRRPPPLQSLLPNARLCLQEPARAPLPSSLRACVLGVLGEGRANVPRSGNSTLPEEHPGPPEIRGGKEGGGGGTPDLMAPPLNHAEGARATGGHGDT